MLNRKTQIRRIPQCHGSARDSPEDFLAVTFRPQTRCTGRCWWAENGDRAWHYRWVVPIDN